MCKILPETGRLLLRFLQNCLHFGLGQAQAHGGGFSPVGFLRQMQPPGLYVQPAAELVPRPGLGPGLEESQSLVEGFAFRITGANGYDVTLETDENGEIFLEGLRIGEYKISEVNNSASAMYILPADKEAAVQTGSTTVVEMHNELRDTPKTGDDSKLGLWLVLAGVSAAGIAACGILGFKKKKKKEGN